MIDPSTKLAVFHDDNGVFADYSNDAQDYLRDDFSVQITAAEDKLYIGYDKPFHVVYVKTTTANAAEDTLTIEKYDGTSWVDASPADQTRGFSRDGFIEWDRSDMEAVEVNSTSKYWVRITWATNSSAMSLRGLNLIFSDDQAMKEEFYEVDSASLLPAGQTSHIDKHVAARNNIIQDLRNRGYLTGTSKINQFDLFDIYEVREAAKHLALSRVFFNLSDELDDQWWAKYLEYRNKYEESIKLAILNIDQDNDGVEDADETAAPLKSMRWSR